MSQTGGPYDTERRGAGSSSASGYGTSSSSGGQPETQSTEDKARHEAAKLGDQAKQRARAAAEERKSSAADQVRGFADVLHKTSDDLRDQHYDAIGEYADDAARRLEGFAQRLRDKDVGTLMGDVERFARRQPALFLGGAVVVGFALSRFLKASGDRYGRDEGYRYGDDFDEDEYGGYYRSGAYRPSTYGSGEYSDTGADRPVPSTTVSGSGGTTAGSAPLSGATTTGTGTTGSSGSLGAGGTSASPGTSTPSASTPSGTSPGTTGASKDTRSTTGGTHGDQ